MSYRSDAVRAAVKEWKAHPSGRDDLYIGSVGGPPGSDWCGEFVLWALQQAGLAKGIRWIQGLGFIAPLGLPLVATPSPGDVAYIPQPFQHQALVISYEPSTGMVTSIDGNQPGIEPRVRFLKNGNIEFYSVQPLIDAAEAAAPTWPFLLAGAAILGAAAWVWEHGLPAPIDRGLRRLGI